MRQKVIRVHILLFIFSVKWWTVLTVQNEDPLFIFCSHLLRRATQLKQIDYLQMQNSHTLLRAISTEGSKMNAAKVGGTAPWKHTTWACDYGTISATVGAKMTESQNQTIYMLRARSEA